MQFKFNDEAVEYIATSAMILEAVEAAGVARPDIESQTLQQVWDMLEEANAQHGVGNFPEVARNRQAVAMAIVAAYWGTAIGIKVGRWAASKPRIRRFARERIGHVQFNPDWRKDLVADLRRMKSTFVVSEVDEDFDLGDPSHDPSRCDTCRLMADVDLTEEATA